MRQEPEKNAGPKAAKNEAPADRPSARPGPEHYSLDEDVKAVFDRFRQAIAARHELALSELRRRWSAT